MKKSACVPRGSLQYMVRCFLLLKLILLWCGKGDAGGCPKLQFQSDAGCRPCSLCNVTSPGDHIRDDCRDSNPQQLANGLVLWCDFKEGDFPECPSIENSVQSCSENCMANKRKFAPGCVCTVGCLGQPSQVVECMDTLQWNISDFPLKCELPSPSPSPTTPEYDDPVEEQTSSPGKGDGVMLTIALGSVVIVILVVVIVVIIMTCLYRRLQDRLCPSPSSGASAAPLLSVSSEKAQNGAVHAGRLTNGAVAVSMDSEKEVGEEASPARHTPNMVVAGTQRRETDGQRDDNEEMQSVRALQDLLNSRQDFINLSKLLDQEYTIDRVTWHDVAVDLLGWGSDDVNHAEYSCRPMTSSPTDSPTYRVLEAARHAGKGLQDLIHCLRRHRKRCHGVNRQRQPCEAEQWLMDFWRQWRNKNGLELPPQEQPC